MSATDMPFARLEALLRGDEPRTLEEKNHASLLAELRAGTLEAPDSLHQRVLSTAPAERRRRVSLPRRRLVLVVVPVAVALAVGAALIHGALNSGNQQHAFAEPLLRQNPRLSPGAAKTAVKKQFPTGTAYSSEHAASGDSILSSAGQTQRRALAPLTGVTIPKNRLVHADATLEVQVPSHAALSKATNQASQIVSQLGGYAQSVQYQASRNGEGNAYLSLRVPVGKAQTALGKLAALGTLVSQSVATQDLQQQLTRQNNGIGSLKRAIAVYEQALKSGTLSATDRVAIQIRLSNAEHSLSALRKARGRTVAAGATADISLTLTTNHNAIVGVHHKSGQFGRMLGDAAHFLGLEGIIVLYALVVLSPVLVLGGLGWVLLRERRRRDERRLLAST